MGIGYTYEYADKKAKQFEFASNNTVKYIDVSVVKTGDKVKCKTISRVKE